MAIVSTTELRALLGLRSSITAEETAVLTYVAAQAEGLLTQYLGYDPEQRVGEFEYYPRHQIGEAASYGVWDANMSHTRAVWERVGSTNDTLQLRRLPVRVMSSVREDSDARFGTASGAFPDGSAWTEGEDYWPMYEEERYCPNGLLIANGVWPVTPGSVRVQYRAGYSRLELDGSSTSTTASDANGEVSNAYLDASPLKRAVTLTVVHGMNKWELSKKSSAIGFGGPLESERAQDYSYKRFGDWLRSAVNVDMPPEAREAASGFVNYGILRA